MKFIVNMVDSRGKSKFKVVDALDVKEAEQKSKKKYPSYQIGRITKDVGNIEYYSKMKQNSKKR
tara:strand:- start:10536 stop:10727 length:192 start_codon:yes stop_codon:yes gene_type:complete